MTKVEALPATVGPAVWSQDGGKIVYLAQAKQDAPPGYVDMYVYRCATKAIVNLDGWIYGDGGAAGADGAAGWWGVGGYGGGGGGGADAVCGGREGEVVKLPVAAVKAAVTNAAQSGWVFLGSSGGQAPELLYARSWGRDEGAGDAGAGAEGCEVRRPKRVSGRTTS